MEKKTQRTESDIIGNVDLPADSLCGIHSFRARSNFGLIGGEIHPRLLMAFGMVKLACAQANETLGYLKEEIAEPIKQACEEMAGGSLIPDIRLGSFQGGAGTSTNMCVNEVIANRALEIMGKNKGSYETISPLEHVNLHQSTNDTYPTALRVAAIFACDELEQLVSELTDELQLKEREFSEVVKLGRTELQDAVAITLGQEFGSYAEAFSKDRWRIYKCKERLRVVNLGGTAIGTGIGADQKYIFMAAEKLRQLTGLPIARAENLVQATQNCDEFAEVSGILKTCATNLFKICSDLRLMSSGPDSGFGEIKLPSAQAGSSIMPGKVNPVIAEMVCQVAIQTISRDTAISMAVMNGQLELNAFVPLIAHNLLYMLEELIESVKRMKGLLIPGITANEERCLENLHSSTAIITAFISKIGYEKASKVIKLANEQGKTIKEVLLEKNYCSEEEYEKMTSLQAILALGFRNRKK